MVALLARSAEGSQTVRGRWPGLVSCVLVSSFPGFLSMLRGIWVAEFVAASFVANMRKGLHCWYVEVDVCCCGLWPACGFIVECSVCSLITQTVVFLYHVLCSFQWSWCCFACLPMVKFTFVLFKTETNAQTCAKGTSMFLKGFSFFSFINKTSSWA